MRFASVERGDISTLLLWLMGLGYTRRASATRSKEFHPQIALDVGVGEPAWSPGGSRRIIALRRRGRVPDESIGIASSPTRAGETLLNLDLSVASWNERALSGWTSVRFAY